MTGRRAVLAAVLGAPLAARAATTGRIVSIGASVTETVFALGAGERVVAVDSTSRFPAEVRALPQVGYMRALAPEGLVALRPDLVLLSEDAGPAEAVAVLRAAGTPLATIPEAQGPEAVMRKIAAVAAAIGADGASLAAAVRADWAVLDAPVATLRPVRTLFVLSAARGAPLVAGQGTQAEAMLRSAGAVNAVSGFTGYRPLSAEAAALAAPEAVVMMDHAVAESGGVDPLLGMPAIAVTPVARNRRVLVVDGSYVLGFGPRAAHARRDLARLLHPGAELPDLPARAWA